jgi:hypothetical protein
MDVPLRRSHAPPLGRRIGVIVIAATFAAMCTNPTSAAQSAVDGRFELSGSGALMLDPPAQQGSNLQLKASLTPAASVDKSVLLADGRFALAGNFAASAVVCYNDTIFRDDFDGDGF